MNVEPSLVGFANACIIHLLIPHWKLKMCQHSTNLIALAIAIANIDEERYSCGFCGFCGMNSWLINYLLYNQVWNERCIGFYFLLLFLCVCVASIAVFALLYGFTFINHSMSYMMFGVWRTIINLSNYNANQNRMNQTKPHHHQQQPTVEHFVADNITTIWKKN